MFSVKTLYILAKNEKNRVAIREAGGIHALMKLLQSNNHHSILSLALKSLTRLTIADPLNVELVSKMKGLPIVLMIIMHRNDSEVKSSAIALLANLMSNHAANQATVIKAGGIQHLAFVLDDMTIKAEASHALAVLALNESNRPLILEHVADF
jgi:hypothetical protein